MAVSPRTSTPRLPWLEPGFASLAFWGPAAAGPRLFGLPVAVLNRHKLLLPSSLAPTVTRQQGLSSCPSLNFVCMPSTHMWTSVLLRELALHEWAAFLLPLLGEVGRGYGRQASLATEELPQGRGEVSATFKKVRREGERRGRGALLLRRAA